MIEDNTPTVTARRRKPTELLRLRLETARRLQGLNARTKAKRAQRAAQSAGAAGATASKKTAPTGSKDPGPPLSTHNADIAPRVPKIKKNTLSHPEKPQSKYKKRQRGKSWLPTHMFHAKRAHMTPPKEPLWRFMIPLSPTEKSYRPTHRASGARGAIAWDMSYISTIALECNNTASISTSTSSIEGVLRAVGIDDDAAWGSKGRKWRAGTRSLDRWVFERDGEKRPIAPVTLIWCGKMGQEQEDVEMVDAGSTKAEAKRKEKKNKKQSKQKLFVRVHPSAFLQVWQELLKASKIQKPQVMLEDLRFDIGSIDVTGPGAVEALLAALKPVCDDGVELAEGSPERIWTSLAGLTNASSLPQNALLAFKVSDPRLNFPPQPIKPPKTEEFMNNLAVTLASWPPDSTQSPSDLFSRPSRLTASRLLPSQKAINRRRTLAGPGRAPPPKPTDPQIPIMLLTSRPRTLSNDTNTQGTWTVLLPWKCVVPVWYSILYSSLSSGGNPRFGGLQEKQQLAFESGEPWFPGDYTGTKAGWQWELQQRERLKQEWERKPKGKRVEYESLNLGGPTKGEIGRGWACDWERILGGTPESSAQPKLDNPSSTDDTKGQNTTNTANKKDAVDNNTNIQEPPPFGIHQLSPSAASSIIAKKLKAEPLPSHLQLLLDKPAFATVKITLMHRGTPTPRARVYRLPTDPFLREQWTFFLQQQQEQQQKQHNRSLAGQTSRSKEQAQSDNDLRTSNTNDLVIPDMDSLTQQSQSQSEPSSLPIPPEEDLIGFVTTGSFNLSAGKGTGIGVLLVNRIELDTPPPPSSLSDLSYISQSSGQVNSSGNADGKQRGRKNKGLGKERLMRTCIVRASGERLGRLGFWEVV